MITRSGSPGDGAAGAFFVFACLWVAIPSTGCDSATVAEADGRPNADAIDASAADPTAALFSDDEILEVAIEMDPADWEVLRYQHHPLFEYVVDDCPLDALPPRPYDYFTAQITVDDELVEQVAVRKKGLLGSVTAVRPSLKISFDEYVPKRRFHGLRRLTLNNNQQDPGQLNTCLSYRIFRGAGLPAPRCNFAHVTVNGHDLGVYSHVESLKRGFLDRQFGDNDGNLYEGRMSDFRPNPVRTFEPKPGNTVDRTDLDAMVEALTAEDDELVAALEPLIDLDHFYGFWAAEVLVGHWDSYSGNRNNFYLYHNPQDSKLYFIPWGPDSAFGDANIFNPEATPISIQARGYLAERLYAIPETRAQYRAKLLGLLDLTWDESTLLGEIDRLEQQTAPHLAYVRAETHQGFLAKMRTFISERRAAIEADIAADPDVEPASDSERCAQVVGQASGSFTTTWGAFPGEERMLSGRGAIDLTLDGEVQSFSAIGATAGESEEPGGPRAGIAIIGLRSEGSPRLAILAVDPTLFVAGATISVENYDVMGVVLEIAMADPSDRRLFGFLRGTVTLEEAGTSTGDAVTGTFLCDVIRL